MRRISSAALLLALLATACDKRAGDGDPKADDFALSLKVEAPAAQVLRVDLPAAALVAIRRADKGDIRVVDAHERPLSMALVEIATALENRIHLDAIPFGINKDGERPSPVSVRVDQPGSSVSVQAEHGEARASGAGVLFDTRKLRNRAVGIALEAALPKQQPVTVSITMGDDLKAWEPVAEQVLFRPGDGAALLEGGRTMLPSVDLHGRYLRASWRGEQLKITGATLFTSSHPQSLRVSVPVTGVKLTDAHGVAFGMPQGLAPAALRVRMTGKDGVVPLSLLGRDTMEASWTPLAMTSLTQGGRDAALALGGGPMRFLRLEADPRSAGFSQTPSIAFEYAPVSLAVAFNGDAPYRLLVGNPEVKPATFALSDLTSQTDPLAKASVVGAPVDVAVAVGNIADGSGLSPRVMALWAVLLAGVALLGYAAFRLMRSL